jgi:hypothetical protein
VKVKPSFSEEKEAKDVALGAAPPAWQSPRAQQTKVFCFFFAKKKALPSLPPAANPMPK